MSARTVRTTVGILSALAAGAGALTVTATPAAALSPTETYRVGSPLSGAFSATVHLATWTCAPGETSSFSQFVTDRIAYSDNGFYFDGGCADGEQTYQLSYRRGLNGRPGVAITSPVQPGDVLQVAWKPVLSGRSATEASTLTVSSSRGWSDSFTGASTVYPYDTGFDLATFEYPSGGDATTVTDGGFCDVVVQGVAVTPEA